jgi:hypothetical protein
MIETEIPNFDNLYQSYTTVFDNIEQRIIELNHGLDPNNFIEYQKELVKFDAKLRLGMAISEIELNETFVRTKFGDLRECHLMFYKLADIWFAYEKFFKLYYLAFNRSETSKIVWLENSSHTDYLNNAEIQGALTRVNSEISSEFNNHIDQLKDYILYCSQLAKDGQKTRLSSIAQNISSLILLPNFSHKDILSLTYGIRNNFVHNGEITIYPETFSYTRKNKLLKSLYKYTVVLTLSAAKLTTNHKLMN